MSDVSNNLIANAFRGRQFRAPNDTNAFAAETLLKAAEAELAYSVLGKPSVMLLPFGVPLPLKNVKYFEVGKSMDILQYRSLNSVFMAQQKGGNWGIRIDGRLVGNDQSVILSLLQLIFNLGKAKKFQNKPMSLEDTTKHDKVTVERKEELAKWVTVDPLSLNQVCQGGGVPWKKNIYLFKTHLARILPSKWLVKLNDAIGNNRPYKGFLPEAVKAPAYGDTAWMKAIDDWEEQEKKGKGDEYGIHLDTKGTGDWACVKIKGNAEWDANLARGTNYQDTGRNKRYLNPTAEFAYTPKDIIGMRKKHFVKNIPVGSLWMNKKGGPGMARHYLCHLHDSLEKFPDGTPVTKSEFEVVREIAYDKNREITAPDDMSWNNAQWHRVFTVITANEILFNMYIETFSYKRSVIDGVDGIEYSLLLRKHVPIRKVKDTYILAASKDGAAGGLDGTLTSSTSLRVPRIVQYDDNQMSERSMAITESMVATVHAFIQTTSMNSTYEVNKFKQSNSIFNLFSITPVNSNKQRFFLDRI